MSSGEPTLWGIPIKTDPTLPPNTYAIETPEGRTIFHDEDDPAEGWAAQVARGIAKRIDSDMMSRLGEPLLEFPALEDWPNGPEPPAFGCPVCALLDFDCGGHDAPA